MRIVFRIVYSVTIDDRLRKIVLVLFAIRNGKNKEDNLQNKFFMLNYFSKKSFIKSRLQMKGRIGTSHVLQLVPK